MRVIRLHVFNQMTELSTGLRMHQPNLRKEFSVRVLRSHSFLWEQWEQERCQFLSSTIGDFDIGRSQASQERKRIGKWERKDRKCSEALCYDGVPLQ